MAVIRCVSVNSLIGFKTNASCRAVTGAPPALARGSGPGPPRRGPPVQARQPVAEARTERRPRCAYVVIDGTLIPIDRVAADRPFYSGKHKKHGMNLQVIASPDGDVLWVSGALPGSVHDKKAEWLWGVLAELEAAGLVTLADKGYQGLRSRRSRTRGRTSPSPRNRPTRRTRNSAHPASARTPSSRTGASSASSAAAPGAAPGAPGKSPRRSTYCRSAWHNEDGNGSISSVLLTNQSRQRTIDTRDQVRNYANDGVHDGQGVLGGS